MKDNGFDTALVIPNLGERLRQEYAPEDIELMRNTIAKGASDSELALFVKQAQRTGLDPFARQIYSIRRKQWDSNTRSFVEQQVIQVSIDGFRLIADRSNEYAGQDGPYWCGPDGNWVEVWLNPEPPTAAKVGVYRHDFTRPLYRVALYKSYVQTNSNGEPLARWKTDPAGMLAKCAEALALRAAFPNDLSGLYTADELSQADKDDGETVNGSFSLPHSAVLTAGGKSQDDFKYALPGAVVTEVPDQPTTPPPAVDPDFVITLEEALAEPSSDGTLYKDMDSGLLANRLRSIKQQLAKSGLAEDVRALYARKRAAIERIQEWKKAGSPNVSAQPGFDLGLAEDPYAVLDKQAETDPHGAFYRLAEKLNWTADQAQGLLAIERGDLDAAYKALRKKVMQSS